MLTVNEKAECFDEKICPQDSIWQCCGELTFLLFAVVFVSCGGGIAALTHSSISMCKNSSHHETSELLELKMSPENI